jgi:hypothetical protein
VALILLGDFRQCKRKNNMFWHDFLLQKMLASMAKIAQYVFNTARTPSKPPGRHRPPAGLDGKMEGTTYPCLTESQLPIGLNTRWKRLTMKDLLALNQIT